MSPTARAPLGSPTLLLFPTDLERTRFEDQGGLPPGHALASVCGFGPVAAAARTSSLIGTLRPRRVLLLGIAGAYDTERHPVGSALAFRRVAIDGVGAGEGPRFQGPPALGFPQWPGSAGTGAAVEDRLELAVPAAAEEALLLTTCAASDSPDHAAQRRARFPEAVAEDMEGFAVALACSLAGTPCAIVRGISNRVGDRDPAHWRIPAALAEARRIGLEVLGDESWAAPARRDAGA